MDPEAGDSPRLRRHWLHGLKCLWRFVTTPSDLANSFDAMFSLAGPTVEREFRCFAEHETGRRLLAQRPRPDLNALLSDHAALAAMPKGSFGRAYLRYLGGEDMGSAEYFLEAADLDEAARRFGWSDDQLWYVRYMANSHDLFHVVSGYDRDVTGEIGIVAFTAGQIPLLPLKLLLPYLAILRPGQAASWLRFLRDAYRHGCGTRSLACADYPALLARPLGEVRRELGVRPLAEVHPDGIPEKGWLLTRVERNVALV